MGERDRIPRESDGPDVEPDAGPELDSALDADPGSAPDGRTHRDPTALAAWRRVAEQRRRRHDEPEPTGPGAGEPAGDDDPLGVGPVGGGPVGGGPIGTGAPGRGAPTPAADEPPRRHDLLLAMAGRVDDDALATVRELVAVGDDAAAAELLGGCLLVGRVGVSGPERDALRTWFSAARVDPALAEALADDPDACTRSRHRFVPELPAAPDGDGESVARAAARLTGVARVLQCWRVTPAGHSPGALPHRVVLVETDAPDDCEPVAHHVAHAARALGPVSVEVFARSSSLPAYQRDALAAAVTASPTPTPSPTSPVPTTPGPATPSPATGSAPAPSSSPSSPLVAPEPSAAGLPVRRRPGAGASLFAPIPATSDPDAGPDEAPDPVPAVTAAPGGTGAATADPEHDEWRVVADADRGLPAAIVPDHAPLHDAPDPALDHDGHHPRGGDSEWEPDDAVDGRRGRLADVRDLDPDEAAARIAALWREPSPVDALEAPYDPDPGGRNLLEPDLPEPDLDAELSRYGRDGVGNGRPVTGSFTRIEAEGPSVEPGRHHYLDGDPAGGDGSDAVTEPGVIRRARHSRPGLDDRPGSDAPGPVGHDARFSAPVVGPWSPGADGDEAVFSSSVDLGGQDPAPPARDPEPSTAPVVAFPGTPASEGPRTASGWSAETEEAVNSQLSDRERDLLARLHAELASRERLDDDAPDPFAAPDGRPPVAGTTGATGRPGPRRSPSPRPRPPSPTPRNGHHHGGGPQPDPPPGGGPVNGSVNGHGPRNGHGLPPEPDPGDGPEDTR